MLVAEYRVVSEAEKNQIQKKKEPDSSPFQTLFFCVTTYYCLTYVTLISAANQLI